MEKVEFEWFPLMSDRARLFMTAADRLNGKTPPLRGDIKGRDDRETIESGLRSFKEGLKENPALKEDPSVRPIFAALARVKNLNDIREVVAALKDVQLAQADPDPAPNPFA